MSRSTDGILAYGFDLGGDEEWKVREAREYGELEIEGYDPGDEDDEGVVGELMRRLLVANGFTETDWQAEGYYARKSAAEKALGVEIEAYCSDGSPMYLLAAKVLTVSRGSVQDVSALFTRFPPRTWATWDRRLAWALNALDLTPLQEEPKWLLASYADGF